MTFLALNVFYLAGLRVKMALWVVKAAGALV